LNREGAEAGITLVQLVMSLRYANSTQLGHSVNKMTMQSGYLRRLQEEEFDQAYHIYLDAFEWLKVKVVRQWLVPITRTTYQERQLRGENFGYFKSGELCAIVSLANMPTKYWATQLGEVSRWWIDTLAVAASHRRMGIGREVVRAVEGCVRALNGEEVFLDCVDEKRFLPRYYGSLGYSVVARQEITYASGNIFPMVLMRKEIGGG
jgi:ribosomal protein S18 acetylase RimI-like enzyme